MIFLDTFIKLLKVKLPFSVEELETENFNFNNNIVGPHLNSENWVFFHIRNLCFAVSTKIHTQRLYYISYS